MSHVPNAMILIHNETLNAAVWYDYALRHDTQEELEQALDRGVLNYGWVGWRMIDIVKERSPRRFDE